MSTVRHRPSQADELNDSGAAIANTLYFADGPSIPLDIHTGECPVPPKSSLTLPQRAQAAISTLFGSLLSPR